MKAHSASTVGLNTKSHKKNQKNWEAGIEDHLISMLEIANKICFKVLFFCKSASAKLLLF